MPAAVSESRCGLCSSEEYMQYKKDTGVVILWLRRSGRDSKQCFSRRDIKELVLLAENVVKKNIRLPQDVDFCLSESIRLRTKISARYRSRFNDPSDWETHDHEYFTGRLREIQQKLRSIIPQIKRKQRQSDTGPSVANCDECINPFTTLHETHDSETPCCEEHSTAVISDAPARKEAREYDLNVPCLVDDSLGNACQLECAMQQLYSIQQILETTWTEAGQGKLPIVLAAFVTNAALALFEEIRQTLEVFCNIRSPPDLWKKLKGLFPFSNDIQESKAEAAFDCMKLGKGLVQLWSDLIEWQNNVAVNPTDLTTMIKTKKAEGVIRIRFTHYCSSNCKPTLHELLQSMMLVSIDFSKRSAVFHRATPMRNEVEAIFQSKSTGLNCVLSSFLLFTSSRCFPSPDSASKKFSMCRLNALRLAQEAIPDIVRVLEDSTMPCRCERTLAYQLAKLVSDLQDFMAVRAFDPLTESPWTAGSHMLEVYDSLLYHGIYLLRYYYYLGSVLHVYNMLRQVTAFKPIPMMDLLLDLFTDELFPGGRPTRRFTPTFERFVGMRLKFLKKSNHQTGCHGYSVPSDKRAQDVGFGARREVNNLRSQSQKVSLIHKIINQDYHINRDMWKHIQSFHSKKSEPESPSEKRNGKASPEMLDSDDPAHRLTILRDSLQSEVTGEFPILRVNIFKIYHDCSLVIAEINEVQYTRGMLESGHHRLDCIEDLLGAADQVSVRGRPWSKTGYDQLLLTAQRRIEKYLGSKPLEHYMWQTGF